MEKFIPIGNRVAVRPENMEKITGGGIVLPDSLEAKIRRGIVIGLGDGILDLNGKVNPITSVAEGDVVLVHVDERYGVKANDTTWIFELDNIIAKIEVIDDDDDADDDED
jgi:co-chaperonin GroES (HSP10)